jgi:hypothetical protein
LCCQLLQQQIQEKRRLLELCHSEDKDPTQTDSPPPPRRHPQDRVRSEVARPRERTIRIEDDPDEGSEDEYHRDRREYHQRSRRHEEPWTPLTVELEQTPWPPRFNAVVLLQYDGETDPREFLLKYEATMESNGGGSTIKAKSFIMAVKGSAQHEFAIIPKGHIYSWSQLRSKLLTSFRGLKIEELTSCDFHNYKQGEKETLQEYMQRIIKLWAKAQNVADLTVIEAATSGLRVGSCQDYLDRCKSNTENSSTLCKNIASLIGEEGEGSKP